MNFLVKRLLRQCNANNFKDFNTMFGGPVSLTLMRVSVIILGAQGHNTALYRGFMRVHSPLKHQVLGGILLSFCFSQESALLRESTRKYGICISWQNASVNN